MQFAFMDVDDVSDRVGPAEMVQPNHIVYPANEVSIHHQVADLELALARQIQLLVVGMGLDDVGCVKVGICCAYNIITCL